MKISLDDIKWSAFLQRLNDEFYDKDFLECYEENMNLNEKEPCCFDGCEIVSGKSFPLCTSHLKDTAGVSLQESKSPDGKDTVVRVFADITFPIEYEFGQHLCGNYISSKELKEEGCDRSNYSIKYTLVDGTSGIINGLGASGGYTRFIKNANDGYGNLVLMSQKCWFVLKARTEIKIGDELNFKYARQSTKVIS